VNGINVCKNENLTKQKGRDNELQLRNNCNNVKPI